MDRKTAIQRLNLLIEHDYDLNNEALKMAITSLENDDIECQDCYYYKEVVWFGDIKSKHYCKFLDRHVFPDGCACQWFEDKE